MRKIRNQQIHSANPGLLFARGVEQLVSDKFYQPARRDRQELKEMRRKPVKHAPRGNIFNVLLRQFTF